MLKWVKSPWLSKTVLEENRRMDGSEGMEWIILWCFWNPVGTVTVTKIRHYNNIQKSKVGMTI